MIIERINLVPQKPFSERIRHIIPIILLAVVTLISTIVYLENNIISGKIEKIDTKISQINTAANDVIQLSAARKKLSAVVNNLQKEHDDLAEKTAKLGRMNAKKTSLSQAILRIAAAIPASIKCNTISFTGMSGQIQGTALNYNDAPRVVKKLNKDPLFKNVLLQDIDQIKDAKRDELRFNILFTLTSG